MKQLNCVYLRLEFKLRRVNLAASSPLKKFPEALVVLKWHLRTCEFYAYL